SVRNAPARRRRRAEVDAADGRANAHDRGRDDGRDRDSCAALLHRRQPVLVNVHVHGVVVAALVVGPDVLLAETNPVELLLRIAVEAVAQLFRIVELAADALDHALLAADIKRRPPMTRWMNRSNAD